MKKKIWIIAGVLIISLSCISEDEFNDIVNEQSGNGGKGAVQVLDNTPVEEINVAFLHGGDQVDWGTSSFTINNISSHASCRLDDKMVLNSDGTYAYSSGDDLCGLADNRNEVTGVWEVGANPSTLVFDKTTANEFTATVVDQTEERIEIIGTYTALGVSLGLRGVFIK